MNFIQKRELRKVLTEKNITTLLQNAGGTAGQLCPAVWVQHLDVTTQWISPWIPLLGVGISDVDPLYWDQIIEEGCCKVILIYFEGWHPLKTAPSTFSEMPQADAQLPRPLVSNVITSAWDGNVFVWTVKGKLSIVGNTTPESSHCKPHVTSEPRCVWTNFRRTSISDSCLLFS